jgi:hypothetical protein
MSLWVNSMTGLPTIDTEVFIELRTPAELWEKMYPQTQHTKGPPVLAVVEGNIVYLSIDFDINDITDRSVLLHEVVHVMQNNSDRVYDCYIHKEQEAYMLQGSWLNQQGVSYFDLFHGDAYRTIMGGSC